MRLRARLICWRRGHVWRENRSYVAQCKRCGQQWAIDWMNGRLGAKLPDAHPEEPKG